VRIGLTIDGVVGKTYGLEYATTNPVFRSVFSGFKLAPGSSILVWLE
jgi:hypothetical protein